MITQPLARRLGVLCLTVSAVISCDSPTAPRGPEPGVLAIVLRTQHANDGAVRVRLSGPDAETIQGAGVAMHSGVSDGVTELVAFGNLADGTVLGRLNVQDVGALGEYSGSVVEAAARSTYAQQPLEGYRIEFDRQ